EGEPNSQRGQQEHEACERAGNPDIEQHALGINRRPYLDEGSEGAQEGRRQKVGQAGVDAVIQGGEVVAELVGQQDGDQSEREGKSVEQERGMPPDQWMEEEV